MSSLNPGDWMARHRREQREREEKARAELKYYTRLLALCGVRTVTAAFDGYGDDGQIDEPVCDPPPPAGLPDGTGDILVGCLDQLLPGGWGNNEGCFGTITLEVTSGEASVALTYRDEEPIDDHALGDE